MTPEQAAEARRRKKEELERQLAALDEEDQYYRASQPPPDVRRHGDGGYHAGSSYPSRSDVVSPPWPQTAVPPTHDWRTAPAPSTASASSSRHRVAPSAFQPLPDPTPMTAPPTSQAPWLREAVPPTASTSSSYRPNNLYTPSPDLQHVHPRMPNPFSASFINIPVPSREQVDTYLIRQQGRPLGLRTGWTISNHAFEVYDLFVGVYRLGGSKSVTRRQWWPEMAEMLGIPGVNSPQGRNLVESGRQLYTFFSTHLLSLEDMWEKTSDTSDRSAGPSRPMTMSSQSQVSRVRQTLSSTRGGGGEDHGELSHSWTSTYPTQATSMHSTHTQHDMIRPVERTSQHSHASQSANTHRQSSGATNTNSGTVPLHVNPTDLSLRRAPATSSFDTYSYHNTGQQNQQRNTYSQPSSQPAARSSGQAQQPSASPVLHQPVPAPLSQSQSAARLDQRAASGAQPDRTMSAATSHAAQTSQTPADAASASTSGNAASANKSKLPTFPSLTNYNPPKFASFDHLVATNALTLPKLPPNVHLDITGSPTEVYAKRCFELRATVKKIQMKEPARQISTEELTFWQKLLAVLRHNPVVIIPGATPMSTANAPSAPIPSAPVASLPQPVAGPSGTSGTTETNGEAPVQGPKKRRGRPPKNPDANGEGSVPPRKRGRPPKNPDANGEGSAPPRKRGRPRKSDAQGVQANGDGTAASAAAASASTGRISADAAMQAIGLQIALDYGITAAPSTAVDPATDGSATAPHADADPSVSVTAPSSDPSKPARKWQPRLNPDGTPVPRKPYTIRVNPDGTPVSDRFKARLSTGQMGHFEVVSANSTPSSSSRKRVGSASASQPVASTSTTLHAHDADAIGEVDTSLPANGIDVTALARQVVQDIPPWTQPAQPTPDSGTKAKNPKLAEAMRARWQRFRAERAALSSQTGIAIDQKPPSKPASASQPQSQSGVPAGRGGFSVPGAASLAAQKRWGAQRAANPAAISKKWSLFHADQVARASGRESTPIDINYGKSARAGSVKPFDSASPRRIISLSGGPSANAVPGPSQTPTRFSASQSSIAGNKPRSSLPLFLSPAPLRVLQSSQSEFGGEDQPIDFTDDAAYEDEEMPPPEPRITRGAASRANDSPARHTRSRPASRISLPNPFRKALASRIDKGKGRATTETAPEPAPRPVSTRSRAAGLFDLSPQKSINGPRATRAASLLTTRPARSRLAAVELPGPSSQRSQPAAPASTRGRSRLVPEVEIPLNTRRASSARPAPAAAPPLESNGGRGRKPWLAGPLVNRFKVNIPGRAKKPVKVFKTTQSKPRARTVVQTQPRRKRSSRKEVRVVVPTNRARRAQLIRAGAYDPFHDDDSDDETTLKRRGHAGLRKIPLPRASMGRTARPTAPEAVPARFTARVGPALLEPFLSILDPDTLLKRTREHECQWKGCDAVLASEWHLRRHFDLRKHAESGSFKAGIYGENTLYRCHWVDCEKPCFSSLADLEQHLTARHISRNLACPWPECGLRFTTLSHLTRHATKHHDSPDDEPVPLATGSQRIPAEPAPDDPLPEAVRTDILMTPRVRGSVYTSVYRREWCRLKVQKGSLAPENPNLFPDHRPHMLETAGEDELADADDDSDLESIYTTLDGGPVTQERLLDEAAGRNKRRLEPSVVLRVRKRSQVGDYQDFFPTVVTVDDDDAGGPALDGSKILEIPSDNEANDGDVTRRTRFALSDEEDEDDGETRGSESEVWAELEDELANAAFTPAAFPADFDFDQLDQAAATAAQEGMDVNVDGNHDEFDYTALAAETFGAGTAAPTPAGEVYATPAAFFDFDDEGEEAAARPGESDAMEVDEEPLFLDNSEEAIGVPDFGDELAALRAAGLLDTTGLETAAGDDTPIEEMAISADASDIGESAQDEGDGDVDVQTDTIIPDVNAVEDIDADADAEPDAGDTIDASAQPSNYDIPPAESPTQDASAVPDFAGLFGKAPIGPPTLDSNGDLDIATQDAQEEVATPAVEPIVQVAEETEVIEAPNEPTSVVPVAPDDAVEPPNPVTAQETGSEAALQDEPTSENAKQLAPVESADLPVPDLETHYVAADDSNPDVDVPKEPATDQIDNGPDTDLPI